jgi:hypothetical protein
MPTNTYRLVLQIDKKVYEVKILPRRSGWRLAYYDPEQEMTITYTVAVQADDRLCCDCLGYQKHRRCKHVRFFNLLSGREEISQVSSCKSDSVR